MKKFNFHPSFLQVIYLIIYVILFSFIIYVPTLINGPVHITGKIIIEEEIIEGSLLGILFFLNILMLTLYRKEASKQKEIIRRINEDKMAAKIKLDDTFKYIGQINVQIQEIKSIFNNTIRFPQTKNDFKKNVLFFSERVLGIVNTNWVLFRIINCNTGKTISEQFETRPGFITDYPHIGNKIIVENQSCPPYSTIISNQQDFNIISCCILPVSEITYDERVFIQAITNEITMMFVLYYYFYQEKSNRIFSVIKPENTVRQLLS